MLLLSAFSCYSVIAIKKKNLGQLQQHAMVILRVQRAAVVIIVNIVMQGERVVYADRQNRQL